uniref:Uncharacterized protein n=1 Tax=Anguilla anguilla TaxID=7936 RepID=A0A0E9X315_ANGAN
MELRWAGVTLNRVAQLVCASHRYLCHFFLLLSVCLFLNVCVICQRCNCVLFFFPFCGWGLINCCIRGF